MAKLKALRQCRVAKAEFRRSAHVNTAIGLQVAQRNLQLVVKSQLKLVQGVKA